MPPTTPPSQLRLKQPQSTFVNRLIYPGHVPKHVHGPDYARNPIGSGPYQLVQWDEGQQLIVEANPTYYGEAPPSGMARQALRPRAMPPGPGW